MQARNVYMTLLVPNFNLQRTMLGWPKQSILQEKPPSQPVLHSLANFSSSASRDFSMRLVSQELPVALATSGLKDITSVFGSVIFFSLLNINALSTANIKLCNLCPCDKGHAINNGQIETSICHKIFLLWC